MSKQLYTNCVQFVSWGKSYREQCGGMRRVEGRTGIVSPEVHFLSKGGSNAMLKACLHPMPYS